MTCASSDKCPLIMVQAVWVSSNINSRGAGSTTTSRSALDTHLVEISGKQLTFNLLAPMSGIGQAI